MSCCSVARFRVIFGTRIKRRHLYLMRIVDNHRERIEIRNKTAELVYKSILLHSLTRKYPYEMYESLSSLFSNSLNRRVDLAPDSLLATILERQFYIQNRNNCLWSLVICNGEWKKQAISFNTTPSSEV